MALTSYNDGGRETQRQAYDAWFEAGYSIRRHMPKYLVGMAAFSVILPGTPITWLLVALFFYIIDSDRRLRMEDPFGRGKGPYIKRLPGAKKSVEEWSVLSTPQHRGGDGIWPMGNNYVTNEEVIASDNIVRTHMVLSGTTGSGKTVTMTSAYAYTAFVSGSGMVMIDGKADPKTWFDLYAMAVAAGRADDFLVLNFVVGASQQATYSLYTDSERALWEEFRAVESNTFNLFGTGNSDTLFEIGSALLGSEASGENKMWVERAEALLRSLLKGMVDLRDKGRIKISVKSLQEYMSLEKLTELENDPDIDKSARDQISAVLNEIPGYRDAMAIEDPQQRSMALADQPSKQFGFLLMQFSALYAMLIGTYGHIATVQYSDIFFPDVVRSRRILLCQLPALEKSPNSMSQLGRMVLSGVKSALSQSISGTLTGKKSEIVDRRPTNSLRALLLIYDEAGSYLQAGTADVASQSRSLGVFNIFSGQEWVSFKSAGDIEAQRIISNSGLKVILKTEDKETCDEFINAVGETHILKSGGKRLDNGKWVEDQRTLEKVPRITTTQIANLAEGQAFMKWRSTMVPLRMPHVDPPSVEKAQRNDLVPIPGSMPTDREQMRDKREVTESILNEAKPALNLVGLCRSFREEAQDAERDSWVLMEKLVRYAYEHQVIIPWEENPPPAGRLDCSEIHALKPVKGAMALHYLLHRSSETHEDLEKARRIVTNGRPSRPPYNPQEESLTQHDQPDTTDSEKDHGEKGEAVSDRINRLLAGEDPDEADQEEDIDDHEIIDDDETESSDEAGDGGDSEVAQDPSGEDPTQDESDEDDAEVSSEARSAILAALGQMPPGSPSPAPEEDPDDLDEVDEVDEVDEADEFDEADAGDDVDDSDHDSEGGYTEDVEVKGNPHGNNTSQEGDIFEKLNRAKPKPRKRSNLK